MTLESNINCPFYYKTHGQGLAGFISGTSLVQIPACILAIVTEVFLDISKFLQPNFCYGFVKLDQDILQVLFQTLKFIIHS
jgi:hypothetical protein